MSYLDPKILVAENLQEAPGPSNASNHNRSPTPVAEPAAKLVMDAKEMYENVRRSWTLISQWISQNVDPDRRGMDKEGIPNQAFVDLKEKLIKTGC